MSVFILSANFPYNPYFYFMKFKPIGQIIYWFCATLLIALFGAKSTALIAFPMVGFFISVMWSIIVSLALNSVATHHGSFLVY